MTQRCKIKLLFLGSEAKSVGCSGATRSKLLVWRTEQRSVVSGKWQSKSKSYLVWNIFIWDMFHMIIYSRHSYFQEKVGIFNQPGRWFDNHNQIVLFPALLTAQYFPLSFDVHHRPVAVVSCFHHSQSYHIIFWMPLFPPRVLIGWLDLYSDNGTFPSCHTWNFCHACCFARPLLYCVMCKMLYSVGV